MSSHSRLKRKASIKSEPSVKESQSLDFSVGDFDASQHSLGEEASTALVALGEMGLHEEAGSGPSASQELVLLAPKQQAPLEQMPSLVVEGIIMRDNTGVVFSLQNTMYAYTSGNTTQQKEVDKALSKNIKDINSVPDHFASRFKTVVGDYSGFLPTVVGGLSKKFKTKKVPTKPVEPPVEIKETRASKRKKT